MQEDHKKPATHIFTQKLLNTSSCRSCQAKRSVVFISLVDWRQNGGLSRAQHTTVEDEGLPPNDHLEDRTRSVINGLLFLVVLL